MGKISEFERVVSHTCLSDKEFFEFYNSYAREKGFSIRKDKPRWKPGTKELVWRKFCCSREGYRRTKWLEKKDQKREPRALSRSYASRRASGLFIILRMAIITSLQSLSTLTYCGLTAI
jgi:hypothetical protein